MLFYVGMLRSICLSAFVFFLIFWFLVIICISHMTSPVQDPFIPETLAQLFVKYEGAMTCHPSWCFPNPPRYYWKRGGEVKLKTNSHTKNTFCRQNSGFQQQFLLQHNSLLQNILLIYSPGWQQSMMKLKMTNWHWKQNLNWKRKLLAS